MLLLLVAMYGFEHLVAIERPGPASDGGYYTMRGRDMQKTVGIAHLEDLWTLGIPSTAIGAQGSPFACVCFQNGVLMPAALRSAL